MTQSPVNGLLEKVLILAFEESEGTESGNIKSARRVYRASVNPEKYSLDYKVNHACSNPAIGSVGQHLRHFYTPPDDLTLEFLFDGTGVIEGVGQTFGELGVFAELEYFKDMLVGYHGISHSPYYLLLIWGPLIFKGCAVDLKIDYKLFNSNGIPIRATATVNFKKSVSDEKSAADLKKSSPDLTHILRIKAGDTLPLLCKKVYGDPKYYFQVAEANGLGNFRQLRPGMEIVFPPIDKITDHTIAT
jgi:phage tail protein X